MHAPFAFCIYLPWSISLLSCKKSCKFFAANFDALAVEDNRVPSESFKVAVFVVLVVWTRGKEHPYTGDALVSNLVNNVHTAATIQFTGRPFMGTLRLRQKWYRNAGKCHMASISETYKVRQCFTACRTDFVCVTIDVELVLFWKTLLLKNVSKKTNALSRCSCKV